jgi:RNA polymerase sigma-70 factor (ECF subfamily)
MNQSCSIPDEKLVKEFTAGDIGAFESLVVRYQKPIVNFIYRMIGNFQEAEDLAQETFIKVYQFAHTYEGRSSFATWLFGIASNLCYDNLRAKSHWDYVFLDAKKEAIREQLLGESAIPSPQQSAENSELAKFIETAIGKLPVQQRQAIVLREYYGFSYTEIAEVTNCSVAAVKSRIHKAKLQLRKELRFLLD